MKIILTGPNTRNDLGYVDAGTTLDIGDGPEQFSATRAAALVDEQRAMAVEETPAPDTDATPAEPTN